MKQSLNVLIAIAVVLVNAFPAFSETKKSDGAVNYFVEGIKYRGEGRCEEAIRSYQAARKLRQFKEDWAYHLAVADCYVALKRYDDAVDAYTRVIEATKNKALQAEMYKGRGRAYYFKAVGPNSLDKKYVGLAQKDLADAKALGADIADVEKIMAADMDIKPLDTGQSEGNQTFSSQPLTIIENANKMITGGGEHVLYLSKETVLKDKSGKAIAASELRPGDTVDFTCITAYRNRADGMLHCSVSAITLKRDASAAPAIDPVDKAAGGDDNSLYIRLLSQRLDRIDKDIREIRERQSQAKKEPSSSAKARLKKKKAKKPKLSEADVILQKSMQ